MTVVQALLIAISSALPRAATESNFTLPSGVKVEIAEAPFDKQSESISGCTESKAICVIGKHIAWGALFEPPKTYVKSISIRYKGKTYSLDTSDMYNAWGGRPLEYKNVIRYFGGQCSDPDNCQFRGLFSDAAGTFVAEWKIIDGTPVRTVLSNSVDIVNLFKKDIDPPDASR